jgi:predicted DNA-binding transcriptional regulator YafY
MLNRNQDLLREKYAMNNAETKAGRLLQIEVMLLDHPEGFTQAEIARRLRVNRSTVLRYLPDLERTPIYESDDGRLHIDRSAYLVNVRLSLHEALAVHLAARLLTTHMDRQNPHAAAALRKLSLALERLAPRISHHMTNSADVMDDAAQRDDPVYLGVLETLTLAWAQCRKVRIWYRKNKGEPVNEYVFSPYFIEPIAVGKATYAIGYSQPQDEKRTLKIERMERAELLNETYTIPPDFDPRDLLADSWGIWYSEGEPVEVVLKFHPRVASRVCETRWIRSQVVEELPDGYLKWRAKVAETTEILPWIRGWGADVEVLQPAELRQTLRDEAKAMAEMYGWRVRK